MHTKKKKILIRIGSLRHGGAEKVLVTFLRNLPADRYEIDLLLNLYSGKYLAEVPAWINILYLNKGEMITTNRLQDLPRKAWRVAFQYLLRQFPALLYGYVLKGQCYDIELAANHALTNELLRSPLPSKKVIWIHSDVFQYLPAGLSVAGILKADKVLAISDDLVKRFREAQHEENPPDKVAKINNPIDTAEILAMANAKAEWKKTVHPLFVACGTLYPAKGFDRLVRVHRNLLDEGLPHHIQIIGDGYDEQNLRKLIEELQVQETVTLLGFQANPYPYLRLADYFVLSSRYEGYPTVLFEAITLGKKIIATEVSGACEMLLDGQLGRIVENSEAGIQAGMRQALQNPASFEPYAERLKGYQMPFEVRNSVKQITDILDNL